MSNTGSFFNLGSQTTLVNENRQTLRLKINDNQTQNDINFVFPLSQGDASGYVLATDGSGTTSWVAPSGGSTNPAGNNTEIQFNDTGAFGASSNLTFDSSTNVLGVSGDVSTNTLNVAAGSNLFSVYIADSLDVDGATTLGNTLTVNDITFLNNNVDVSGDISLNSNILMSSGIRIGDASSGEVGQDDSAIAIGQGAGALNQQLNTVAIGTSAGADTQGSSSIAIGEIAGYNNLGQNSIAIGKAAETDNTIIPTQNVIVLNATDTSLNSDVSSALFIKPLRDVSSVSTPGSRTRSDYKVMVYDSSSGEVAFDASYTGIVNPSEPAGPTNAIQFNGGASDFSGVSNLTFDSSTNTLDINASTNITGPTTIDGDNLVNGLSISNSLGDAINIDANTVTGISIDNASTAIAVLSGSIEINNSTDSDHIKFSDSVYITNNNINTNSSIRIGQNVGKSTDSSGVISIGKNSGNSSSKEIIDSIFIGNGAETIDASMSNVIVFNTSSDTSLNADISSALFIKPLRDVSSVSTPGSRTRNDYKVMVYDSSSGEVAFDASYTGIVNPSEAAGPANAIQFNGGASDFSGVSNLTFDSSTNVLGVSGDISLNGDIIINGSASDSTITSDASLSIIAENGNIVIEASAGTVDISASQINLVNQIIDNSGGSINTGSITSSGGVNITSSTLTLDNSSSLVMTPRVYTDVSDFSGQDLEPASSILIFDYSNNQNIDCSLNYVTGITNPGQHLSIFYLNYNSTPGNLRIDFGDNNIVTGSGPNRYLTFNSLGQSAELLAYGTGGELQDSYNYLVFNTGATASS